MSSTRSLRSFTSAYVYLGRWNGTLLHLCETFAKMPSFHGTAKKKPRPVKLCIYGTDNMKSPKTGYLESYGTDMQCRCTPYPTNVIRVIVE